MNLALTIDLYFAGTSEGAKKAWEERGRGEIYHGTTESFVNEARVRGLRPKSRSRVFTTDDHEEAFKYGKITADDSKEQVLAVVVMDKGLVRRQIKQDKLQPDTHWMSRKVIPPSAIKRIEFYNVADSYGAKPIKVEYVNRSGRK